MSDNLIVTEFTFKNGLNRLMEEMEDNVEIDVEDLSSRIDDIDLELGDNLGRVGYIRQLTASPNTIIGNGTTFTTSFNVGDAIYARNEANDESVFVTVVSIANDTHMVTNGSLIHIGTTYYPNTLFAQTATSSSGSRLHYPRQITSQMDMIIFNSTGANTDGQYAINVVSSTSSGNVVMALSSPYEGANLSQGVFSWISSGARSGRQL